MGKERHGWRGGRGTVGDGWTMAALGRTHMDQWGWRWEWEWGGAGADAAELLTCKVKWIRVSCAVLSRSTLRQVYGLLAAVPL